MREVEVGKRYKHFKGQIYKVLMIALDSETNEEKPKKVVVYQALYGDNLIWVRDYDMFLSNVDKDKYPEIKQEYRFERI
ncbi:MAG: DUF1653 domain-containing protein [Bacilli bacterium]